MNFKTGEQITAGTLAETDLVFTSNYPFGFLLAFIEVVDSAGGIQFGTETISAGNKLFTTGAKIPITFMPNVLPLKFKATSVNDKFVITV